MGKYINFFDDQFFGSGYKNKFNKIAESKLGKLNGLALMSIPANMHSILVFEYHNKKKLTALAIQTVKENFPVIDLAGIQIRAEIKTDGISFEDLTPNGVPEYPKETPINDPELYNKIAKQKVLNAISQGAGVAMNSIQHMHAETLSKINPQIVEKYDNMLKTNDAMYFTPPEVMFISATKANKDKMVGGVNKVSFENKVPIITAKACNFVVLIHEIVKGVYTYLTLNAYEDVNEYYKISEYTDSIFSEIEDIGSGKIILETLKEYLLDNFDKYWTNPSFFEMFIVKLSKVPADEFVSLTKGLMNGNPDKARFETLAIASAKSLNG